MKYIKTDNGVIVTEEKNHSDETCSRPCLSCNPLPLPVGTEIEPVDIGNRSCRSAGRDLSISSLVWSRQFTCLAMGLVSGGNVFLWSLPGAAKSTMARMLAAGISGDFFSLNLGPDTGKSDLFGPPSLSAMKKDQWDRAWSTGCHCPYHSL